MAEEPPNHRSCGKVRKKFKSLKLVLTGVKGQKNVPFSPVGEESRPLYRVHDISQPNPCGEQTSYRAGSLSLATSQEPSLVQ